MTNSKLLERKIKESGLKKSKIAEYLGISIVTLKRKIDNKNAFMAEEILILCDILHITKREREAIFFSNDVGKTPTKSIK